MADKWPPLKFLNKIGTYQGMDIFEDPDLPPNTVWVLDPNRIIISRDWEPWWKRLWRRIRG